MPYSGGQPLHVSELELPDHPGSKEVGFHLDIRKRKLQLNRMRILEKMKKKEPMSSSVAV